MTTVRKNGKAYDGGDVQIAMFGSLSYEVTELTYNTEQEHQLNHSLGSNRGTSYSMGMITNTATMTMRLASVSVIEKAAGSDLLKIKPFEINVTFVNEDNDIINDTLLVKFQNQGRDVPNEMDLKKQFTLFVLDVKYNNV
ncbi:hypothetical protein [Carboxylicivirga linearis]|uniref:Uncharacterized protein n=1 Tax=Carboxylicivirga linearis TaxID=1628157 RepID=A0ABS5K0R2_9BACT|nr:hypothetical protein [Carboxylicivirga linearis]MBS2100708.1 hypothetical protein [Carboxylicivirga linearis]